LSGAGLWSILFSVPKFVSDLEMSLSGYVHTDLNFMDVLNEVLPQLASRGIWKDLTFEETISLVKADRFFTLPEAADSVLHALVNNEPTAIKPLWNAYINTGASDGRMGHWYGVEDAGYAPTKDILSKEFYYALYIMPNFRWGEMDDQTVVRSDSAFAGTETVTIEYENWEGIIRTSTDTMAASASPALLSPRAVRNIRSISYDGFATVPALVVAVPVKHFGILTKTGSGGTAVATVIPIPELPSAYTDLGSATLTADVFSLIDNTTIDDHDISFNTVSDSSMNTAAGAYAGGTAAIHPVMVVSATHENEALFRTGYAKDDSKKMAVLEGTGITRYRVFRQQDPGNTVHLLLRRKIPKFTEDNEIVYLDNVSALKYAILANTAEFNNDATQARIWWGEAERELNAELNKTLGAAQPQVIFDPSGGQGPVESLQ
jgi:hypothetical protein